MNIKTLMRMSSYFLSTLPALTKIPYGATWHLLASPRSFAAVTRGTIPHLFFSFSLKVFPSPLMFFTIC